MVLFRRALSINNIAGAFIIVLGLCLTNRFSLAAFAGAGTVYMLLGCVCNAAYTIAADHFTKREDPLLIGITQMGFTALTAFGLWYIEDPLTFSNISYTREMLSSVFILAFFAKAYAYIVLMFSQKYTDPVSVTVIASTEPVVTLLLAVLLPAAYGGSEPLSLFALLGAMVIAIGAMVSGGSFLTPKRLKNKEDKPLAS
jgi:drug/metabolite transporter (DMT)-like permease